MDFKQGDNSQQDQNNQKNSNPDPIKEIFKQIKSQANIGKKNSTPDNGEPKEPFKLPMKSIILLIAVVVILSSLSSFIFIVAEDEVATVRVFGDISKVIVDRDNILAKDQNALDPNFSNVEIVNSKGLFFKLPFITTIQKDTSKLITYISSPAQINTRDKIKYKIAMFAQWEITHPGIYRSSLGNEIEANNKIDEVAYAVVIQKVNGLTSTEFLTDKDKLYGSLDQAMEEINIVFANKGIVLRDIEVYRTILPDSNIDSTYRKMIAERAAIAQRKRSEGQEIFQNTVADTDRKVIEIIAESIETSEKIKGEADATALEIYANAFSRDPEFYTFWRTLNSYETTIDEDTVIYMDKNNSYLDLFSKGNN
ncbi:MAG: protease modulator HflC [Acidaminobacteraceae bacterium]